MNIAAPRDPRDLLVTHLPALRAFALSLTRNGTRADDLVQETVLKAWAKIDSFTPGTNLRAWLFTIQRNTFYSERRKAAREVEDVDGIYAGGLASKPDHDGRLALADFKRAFNKLKDEQREALILVGASGFSYDEAAAMCGVATGTIKSRANRARRKLMDLLGMDAGDPLEMTDRATMAVLHVRGAGATR